MKSQPVRLGSGLRVLRGVTAGITMLLLTAAAHITASGTAPSAASFVVLAPVAIGLSSVALERRRGYVWLAVFAVGIQALLHVLLSVTGAHAAMHSSLLPSPGMTLTHIGAAITTALVLAHADVLLHRWIALARTLLFTGISFEAQPLAPVHTLAYDDPNAHYLHDLDHAVSRRGPPPVICY
ncbi:MAG: hypothetical protein WC005_03670 [Candidatus Nanopelagicales bacterium]